MTSFLDSFNADQLPEQAQGGSNSSSRTKSLTVPDGKPMICKIIPIVYMKDAAGNPAFYYGFNKFTYKRKMPDGTLANWTRPSVQVLGQKDPQFELFMDLKKKQKEIKDKESPEYKALDTQARLHRPTKRGVLLVNVLGSDKIEPLEVPETVINMLFGREGYGDRPAEEGLYQTLRRKGTNLFNTMSSTGWLRISRTGTGLDTKYHVDLYRTEQKVEGMDEPVLAVFKSEPSQALKNLKESDLPDVVEVASNYMWSVGEVQEYLQTGKTPDRRSSTTTNAVSTTEEDDVPTMPRTTAPQPAATQSASTSTSKVSSMDDALDAVFR
jgi:hypothetical protein